jgi:hypothetical protein
MTLDAPKLRRSDELVPPDDEEETAEEKERRDLDYCDKLLDERRDKACLNGR